MTNSSTSSDHVLVRRLRNGETAAFEQLYDAYYERLWRFAYSFVRTRAIAQEIVHDVFLALWVGRGTLHVHTTLDGYLYGAIRNHALKFVRHERVVEREASRTIQHQEEEGGRGTVDVHDVLEREELHAELDRAIASLPERHRTAVLLRWRHGMRYEELATVLEVSPQAARTLVLRVQETLKTLIRRAG